MNDLLSKEIGDFLEGGSGEEPPKDPPVEDPPPEEPPAEPPTEDPPPEEPPPEEPPPEEPPAEPPPEEPPEDVPITEREQLLLDRLEKVTGEKLDIGDAVAPAAPAPPAAPPAEPEPPKEPEIPNFFGEMTLDEIQDDPEKFQQVLTNVYNSAQTVAEQKAVEKVLKSIPQLVVNYVSRHAAMANLVSDFYKENEDLAGTKRTVAAVANEVAAEHPDWEVNKVFDEAAVRSRKVLGLAAKKAGPKEPPAKPKKPAFQKQGSRGAPPGPGLTGVAKEIDELITEE